MHKHGNIYTVAEDLWCLLVLVIVLYYCLAAYRLVIKFCVFNIILISWSHGHYCMHD
jgi:hypothetical protein